MFLHMQDVFPRFTSSSCFFSSRRVTSFSSSGSSTAGHGEEARCPIHAPDSQCILHVVFSPMVLAMQLKVTSVPWGNLQNGKVPVLHPTHSYSLHSFIPHTTNYLLSPSLCLSLSRVPLLCLVERLPVLVDECPLNLGRWGAGGVRASLQVNAGDVPSRDQVTGAVSQHN